MKNAYRLLVVDSDQNTCNQLRNYFSSHAVMNVVKVVDNGSDALEFILNHQSQYDCIIIDLLLPGIDGLSILEKMKQNNIKKKIFVLTSFKDTSVFKSLGKYNISYYMMKPFSLESLEMRLKDVLLSDNYINSQDKEVQRRISKILHTLGVPAHIKGYLYIRDGITMMYSAPDILGGITKEIYPEIAKKYNTTPSRVERAIRHAIEISWNRGDYDTMDEIFGHSVDYDKAKPTNSEFIATIADHIKMESVQIF